MSNAMHLALEALEQSPPTPRTQQAIAALRDAIEQKPADIPEGERTTLVGIKADGTQHVVGHARISTKMKAREIVRDMFGAIDDDGYNDAAMAYDCCEQLIDWLPKQHVVVLAVSPQPAAPQPVAVPDKLRTARGAIAELEAKVFAQERALDVLRASVSGYQRDMADPPGYLQDAVIKAAGLGAMAEEIKALKSALAAAPQAPSREPWQPIETAPKGARGYAWMLLCWGEEEDPITGHGFHAEGRFFAAATFFKLSGFPAFEYRQIEVFPTHWMPLPAAPGITKEGGTQ